jgi:hypothetical protein
MAGPPLCSAAFPQVRAPSISTAALAASWRAEHGDPMIAGGALLSPKPLVQGTAAERQVAQVVTADQSPSPESPAEQLGQRSASGSTVRVLLAGPANTPVEDGHECDGRGPGRTSWCGLNSSLVPQAGRLPTGPPVEPQKAAQHFATRDDHRSCPGSERSARSPAKHVRTGLRPQRRGGCAQAPPGDSREHRDVKPADGQKCRPPRGTHR